MKKSNNQDMVANDYGIMIKKCCASCANRDFDDQERRCCQLTGKHVRGNGVCDDWSMSDGLKCLGCERGRVQRREYQLTLLEVRASENLARMRGLTVDPKPLEDIQKEFENEHGSRFLF